MLVNKPATNAVTTFKTLSGEEFIARMQSETDDAVEITKPMSLVPMNSQGVGLVPFIMTMAENSVISIKKSSIIAYGPTSPEIAKDYMSQTSSIKMA